MKERIQATVYVPSRARDTRKGKGFSRTELREAGMTEQEALRRGIPVDKRRRTSHARNVKKLKHYVTVREGDLTDIKGIGPASEQELREVGIESIQDMIDANLEELSEAVSFSEKTLKKWQEDAASLLTE